MLSSTAFAHDIEVQNSDGVTIYYIFTNNQTELAVSYRGSDYDSYRNEYQGTVIIPASVTYNGKTYSVTSIGNYAFYYCSGLTSITIPESVTSIGSTAFLRCSGLTSITIPESVTSIGYSAFTSCTGLTSIKVPVSDYASFCNNSIVFLIRIYIGKPITLIDKDGTEITEYVIPNTVTSIKDYAFSGCSSLTSITIPNSVTEIGTYAFSGCSKIQSVVIGNGVTAISNYSFATGHSIESFTIGSSVLSISANAFNYKP